MPETVQRFLCISSYEKGQDFMRQCAEMGVKPTLLTVEKLRDAPWPHDILEDISFMPDNFTVDDLIKTVCWMCRGRHFDRVVALDEFDLDATAKIREHTRIPGMGVTSTAYYRDKLAMRTGASESGFLVPEFCRVLNYDELRAYLKGVHGPWLLKPRAEASALGIRKIYEPEQLWRTLDELGDLQTNYLLEQFVPGDIFHVDSVISEHKVVFSAVHQYGKPPMQVMHEGGVFTTRTVDRSSREWKDLTELNARLAPDLGMARGVTHGEYIRAHADGRLYFLEIAARVGGAFISDLVEAATGINLWREWARIEVCRCARRGVRVAEIYGEVCGQRALPGEDRGARHQRFQRARNCYAHEKASSCRADRVFRKRGPGEGTAGPVQRGVRATISCGAAATR